MKHSLTLHLPGLCALPRRLQPDTVQLDMPLVERFCRQATRRECAAGRWGGLAERVLVNPQSTSLPLANLLVMSDGVAEWLIAEPVYLEAGIDDLIMAGAAPLALQPGDIENLAEILSGHFSGDFSIRHDARRLYIGRDAWQLETVPLHRVQGHGVRDNLPSGPDARQAISWMNEIQMLLHDSAFNRERETRGVLPVSGCWFWGEGRRASLHAELAMPIRWYGEDDLLKGIAQQYGDDFIALPDNLAAVDFSQDVQLLDTRLADALDHNDLEEWQRGITAVESSWLAPAMDLLARGALNEVVLYPGDSHEYSLRNSDAWKFWRRWREWQIAAES